MGMWALSAHLGSPGWRMQGSGAWRGEFLGDEDFCAGLESARGWCLTVLQRLKELIDKGPSVTPGAS